MQKILRERVKFYSLILQLINFRYIKKLNFVGYSIDQIVQKNKPTINNYYCYEHHNE